MALDKTKTLPGVQIRVKALKENTAGVSLFGPKTLPALPIMSSVGGGLGPYVAMAGIGDILTVVRSPRKMQGINTCRVATASGIEGEVYWSWLRSNCEYV